MTGGIGSLAAAVLAIVFVVAAGSKLRDPLATRRTLRGFGLPNPRLLAVVLPVTEGATALLLVVNPRTGGPCAVALLAAFTTLIAVPPVPLVEGHRTQPGSDRTRGCIHAGLRPVAASLLPSQPRRWNPADTTFGHDHLEETRPWMH